MDPLRDPDAVRLAAGPLAATFLPGFGMLGASLTWRGVELLRRVDDLAAAAASGSTAGIPLLHPWANRLAGLGDAAAGHRVTRDPASPLLHLDGSGLPIHGVPWSRLAWSIGTQSADAVTAALRWGSPEQLAVFPYPHRLALTAQLSPRALTVEVCLTADRTGPVPVSFGFHPYLGLPGLPREQWRLELPRMRRLVADGQGIPTGDEQDYRGFAGALDDITFDDGFALPGGAPQLAIAGGGLRIAVEPLAGYGFAQVFAPPGKALIALEPMTAPTNALASGRGLQLVPPGGTYRAAFRIAIAEAP
ncbi:MAG: aldose 1-epimerase [Dongiaceae bacterium]